MSGLEVAGLAVGVTIPVVAEVIKAYSSTRKKLKTYRGYSRDLHQLHQQLAMHQQNFLDDCQRILRKVTDEPEDMVDNLNHRAWRDPQLNQLLNGRLKNNCNSCTSIFESVKDALAESTKKYDALTCCKQRDSRHEAPTHLNFQPANAR